MFSFIGVPALERMMTVAYMEKPMIMAVRQRRTVLASVCPRLRVVDRPTKRPASSRTMNVAAPLLNGSPNTLTNSRSEYAAAFGRSGMSPKRIAASIVHDRMNIPSSCMRLYLPSSFIR